MALELEIRARIAEPSQHPGHARRMVGLERQLGRKTLEVEILKEALDKARSKKPTLLAQSLLRDGSR